MPPGQLETTTFTVSADDGFGSVSNAATTVASLSVNDAPVFDPIGNKQIDEQTQLAFTVTAADPDANDTLTYSLIGDIPAGASIDIHSGAFAWTPTEAQGPGVFSFSVRVSDDGDPSLFDEEEITITINEVNRPPAIETIAPQEIDEHSLLSFPVIAGDPDLPANHLTYELIDPAMTGAMIDDHGLILWTPGEEHGGNTYDFIVRVTDNGSPALFDERTFTVTVQEVNDAPTIAATSPVATDEDTSFTFSTAGGNPIIIHDPDAGTNPIQVTLTSQHGTITLSQLTNLTFSAGTGTGDYIMTFTGTFTDINAALDGLIFSPDLNFHGPADLMISVNDLGHSGTGGPKVAGETIGVDISSVDDPPVAENDEYFVQKNGVLSVEPFGVLANDFDADDDPLAAQLVTAPGHGDLTLRPDGSFEYTPKKGFSGVDQFTYLAVAGPLASAPATVALVVAQAQPPKIENLKQTRPTFSPDSKQILIAGVANQGGEYVYLYDVAKRTPAEYEVPGGMDFVLNTPAAFSPNGKYFAVGGSARNDASGFTAVWGVNGSRKAVRLFAVSKKEDQQVAQSVTFSPDSKSLAVGYASRVDVFEIASGKLRASLDVKAALGGGAIKVDSISALAFNPANPSQLVIAGPDQAKVVVWDTAANENATSTIDAPFRVFTLAFSTDGKTLFVQGTTIQILDFAARKKLQELEVRTKPVGGVRVPMRSMALSPDRKTILVGLADGSTKEVAVFEFDAVQKEFKSNPTTIFTAAENGVARFISISNDGKYFTTADEGLAIWLWELGKYKNQAPFRKIQS